MKVATLIFFSLLISACDRVDFELRQMSKEIEAEEAHLQKVADGTRIFDNDPEPKWPGADGDKTLEGIDGDNDGLRDDVEIWINEHVKDNNLGHHGNLRRAVKQYARDQIKFILGYEQSKDEIIKLHEQRMKSNECANFFWFLIPEQELDNNKYTSIIGSKIISTYDRKKSHTKSSNTLGSFYYSSFDTQPGERAKFCQFKVEFLQDYLNQFIKDSPRTYKNLKAEDLQ